MDFIDFTDVSYEIRGDMVPGKLKLTDEKIIFKGKNRKEEIKCEKLDIVNWQRLAGSWGIRIFCKDGSLHRFAGFKEPERERLAKFFKSSYKLDMLDRELSVKGWNWGRANFEGGVLGFEVGKSDAFEIPLSYVNQCLPGKNEVTLEFHSNDDAPVMLTEMRFHIPPSELAGEDKVEAFKDSVLAKASVVTTSGDAIAIFREIKCLSPRGRYDIKIFPSYFHLHGKTFDYMIQVQSVMRLFLLPHKDQRQMHFAVNVDPPIKQGQTRYHFLVMIFNQDDEEDVELSLTDEELQTKFDGRLEKEMSGPTFEVISKLMKGITGKKVTLPGNFVGHSGTPAITCSHKAASGFVYPMERGFIYIYKPPIYIRYDEVRNVSFERSGGSTRSFDINVTTNNDISYTFSSIEKGEYSRLFEFLKNKGIKVKTSGTTDSKSGLRFEDDDVDHHLHKVRADAAEFDEDDGDSMSSDDSDFNPDALEALSAKEEYDSDPSSSSEEDSADEGSGSDAERKRAEKRKKKEEKKEKRAKSGGGEKRERKKKMTKLPGQPKRNMSAYFLWMNESREKIKEDFPNLSIAEFGKKAGELWKALSDKSEWETKAAEDKKRYDAEMEKWKAEGGAEAMAAEKKKQKAARRSEKKAATSGGTASSSKSTPSKVDPKGGTGTAFKSKEFVEDSSSNSE